MPKKPKRNEIVCPKCKEPIAVTAEICPHCRTEFTPEKVAARVKASNRNTALGCLAVALLICFVATCSIISEPSIPKDPQASAKADVLTFNKGIYAASAECDSAYQPLAKALGNADTVAAYRAAGMAEASCLNVDFSKVEIPVSVGEQNHADLVKARDACSNAYAAKWSAAKQLKEALDGGSKPSAMVAIQDAAASVQRNGIACAAGITAVAMKLGATGEELGLAAAKK